MKKGGLYRGRNKCYPKTILSSTEDARKVSGREKKIDQKTSDRSIVGSETSSVDDGEHGFTASTIKKNSSCQYECSKCQSKNAIYRPLIAEHGEFLCNSCYKHYFPVTAMTKDHTNGFFKFQTKSNIYNHNESSKNKNEFAEEKECRLCLEKGLFRPCCEKYYCNQCYFTYKTKACPGCDIPIYKTGVMRTSSIISKPRALTIFASWTLSATLIIMCVSIITVTTTNYYTAPKTIWGHQCSGWFPKCKFEVCIDTGLNEYQGMPSRYKYCDITQTQEKVIGKACIFDPELYEWSDKLMGFDFCVNNDSDKINGPDGLYVFEDNFDYWMESERNNFSSTIMPSAKWEMIENGEATDICGFRNGTYKYEEHLKTVSSINDYSNLKIPSALVFSGVQFRYAQTLSLDVSHGGRVEFFLKMAPVLSDEYISPCKSAFSGDINLSYKLSGETHWVVFAIYTVWKFRKNDFTFISENIPTDAMSSGTKFRWNQPSFDSIRDYWALEDVRIMSYFSPTWKQAIDTKRSQESRLERIHELQCCLDTEHCQMFPNYMGRSDEGIDNCQSNISAIYGVRHHFRLKLVEKIIVIASLIIFFQKGYIDICQFLISSKRTNDTKKRSHEIIHSDKAKDTFSTKKEFNLEKNLSWQIVAVTIMWLPSIICWANLVLIIVYASEHQQILASTTLLYIAAISMDIWTLRWLSINIFHLWPCHQLPYIVVNTSSNKNIIQFKDKVNRTIHLNNVYKIDQISREHYISLFVCVTLSGLPLSGICILIRSFDLSNEAYLLLLRITGCLSFLRSFIGPDWFVKIFLSLRWIMTISSADRKITAVSLGMPVLRYWMSFVAAFFAIIGVTYIAVNRDKDCADNLFVVLCFITGSIMFGTMVGATIGMLQGLPVVQDIHLTTWPTSGFTTSYKEEVKLPFLFYFTYCSLMHSHNKLQLVILDDMVSYNDLLSGISPEKDETNSEQNL